MFMVTMQQDRAVRRETATVLVKIHRVEDVAVSLMSLEIKDGAEGNLIFMIQKIMLLMLRYSLLHTVYGRYRIH